MTTLVPTSLSDLAEAANREHLACEQAYGSAIEHAFRAGEHLLAAKAEVEHGEWLPWLAENFRASERTAQGYMRIATEGNPQALADSGIEEGLRSLATPRPTGAGEEVEGEVVVEGGEASRSLLDMLRDSDGIEGASEELSERDQGTFPRTGVERTTVRQMRDAAAGAQRAFDHALSRDISDWTRAEALTRAARAYGEAAESAEGLASMLRSSL